MTALRRSVRRIRLWLARLIMPSQVVVWDLGPFVDAMQQATIAMRRLESQRTDFAADEHENARRP